MAFDTPIDISNMQDFITACLGWNIGTVLLLENILSLRKKLSQYVMSYIEDINSDLLPERYPKLNTYLSNLKKFGSNQFSLLLRLFVSIISILCTFSCFMLLLYPAHIQIFNGYSSKTWVSPPAWFFLISCLWPAFVFFMIVIRTIIFYIFSVVLLLMIKVIIHCSAENNDINKVDLS